MADAMVVIEPPVGITPQQLADWWTADPDARQIGSASVQPATTAAYGPEIVEWVVVPLVVNLASSALYDTVKRLITRARPAPTPDTEVEIIQGTTDRGDPVVVVRTRYSSRP